MIMIFKVWWYIIIKSPDYSALLCMPADQDLHWLLKLEQLKPWSVSTIFTGPRSIVRNVSSSRCVSQCRSRGHKFDLDPVPYLHADQSWKNFYCHSLSPLPSADSRMVVVSYKRKWERSGSVVECLTRDRGVAGSNLTDVTALWSLNKTHFSLLSTGSTQEDPSLFYWKIVDGT